MADAPDLGSGSERIGGSSPLARTTLFSGNQIYKMDRRKRVFRHPEFIRICEDKPTKQVFSEASFIGTALTESNL